MPSDPSTLLSVRNTIYAQLENELAPTGRLNGVQAVGYAWLNATKLFPYVSIYAAGRDERTEAVRQKRNTMHFVIALAVESKVSLEDAYTQLYTYMDDGNGNGLESILRDPNHYTWSNTCNWSEITSVRYYDNVDTSKQSAQTSFVAYAVVQYDAIQLLSVTGTIS